MRQLRWTLALAALLLTPGPSAAQTAEEFTAQTVDARTGARESIRISIPRWTTNADQLVAMLKEKGPQALMKFLRSQPRAGSFYTTSGQYSDVLFAKREETPGGRRIVLLTDWPNPFEQANNTDRPYRTIELRLRPDGKGEGHMSVAAKLAADSSGLRAGPDDTRFVELTNVVSFAVR